MPLPLFSLFGARKQKKDDKRASVASAPSYEKDDELEGEEEEVKEARSAATSVAPASIRIGDDDKGVESRGYKYAEDSIANILAFICGNAEGEEKLKKLRADASGIEDSEERREFFEKELRSLAADSDSKISGGLKGFLDRGMSTEGRIGAGFCEDDAFKMMQGLGFNPCRENFSTSFDAGPPKTFTMIFVNRPHSDVADKDSTRSLLAADYSNTLSGEEKKEFDDKWKEHEGHAAAGGPVIPTKEFKKSAAQIRENMEKERVAAIQRAVAKEMAKRGSGLSGIAIDDCAEEESMDHKLPKKEPTEEKSAART